MAGRDEVVAALAHFSLFADLATPQLEAIAGELTEAWFAKGDRILRQGLSGSNLYVVIEGECTIAVDGAERARLGPGEFFGEISVLLGEPPSADVAAITPVRCLMVPAPAAEAFLVGHPRLMFRMLQAQARRLRNANRWRS